MTSTRRYSFEWPGPWVRGRYDNMLKEAQTLCAAYWWYDDARIEGEPFGRLVLLVTVTARDQWWALQRATDLAVKVFAVAGIRKRVPYPTWEPLAPPPKEKKVRPPTALPVRLPGEGIVDTQWEVGDYEIRW